MFDRQIASALFLKLALTLMGLPLLGLCFSSPASAGTPILIVSDIDDTLKQAYVRSPLRKSINAFFDYAEFPGMSDLYRNLNQNSAATIHYVSNAPEYLMQKRHQRFLEQFNFPHPQNLHTRPDIDNDSFKVEMILGLVEKEQPEVLVLIGDDGECDPVYFYMIRQALASSKIKIISFVHSVYSQFDFPKDLLSSPATASFYYVTPVEIALNLHHLGLLGESQLQEVTSALLPKLLEDLRNTSQSYTFPQWKDCSEAERQWPQPPAPLAGLEELRSLVSKRCGHQAPNTEPETGSVALGKQESNSDNHR